MILAGCGSYKRANSAANRGLFARISLIAHVTIAASGCVFPDNGDDQDSELNKLIMRGCDEGLTVLLQRARGTTALSE